MKIRTGVDFSNFASKPRARTKDIVVQNVGDESLVYDLSNEKASHLNKTSYQLWKLCDGERTIDEIAIRLSEITGEVIEADFVWIGLADLNKAKLLEVDEEKFEIPDLSRRDVLFRYALPSLTLPIVVSLVAPLAVSAQSCAPGFGQVGDPCNVTADCCPGLTCILPGVAAFGICG